MELHGVHRLALDTHALNNVVALRPRGNHQRIRHRIGLDGQRMVAGGGHGVGHALENLVIDMFHQAGLAMHDGGRMVHSAAVHLSERLQAQAHTKHRHAAGRAQANHILTGTGFGRSARAGRNQHAIVTVQYTRRGWVDSVVTHHINSGAKGLQIAYDRVDEGIVVIHHQNMRGIGHRALLEGRVLQAIVLGCRQLAATKFDICCRNGILAAAQGNPHWNSAAAAANSSRASSSHRIGATPGCRRNSPP